MCFVVVVVVIVIVVVVVVVVVAVCVLRIVSQRSSFPVFSLPRGGSLHHSFQCGTDTTTIGVVPILPQLVGAMQASTLVVFLPTPVSWKEE